MMKNYAICVAVALGTALTAVSGRAATVVNGDSLVLTLDECVAIALDKNPTVKVADMEITRVDYSKKEVLGQLFPEINFVGSYSRTLAKQTMYMNMSGLTGSSSSSSDDSSSDDSASSSSSSSGSQGIKMGLDNSYQVGFSGTLPLIAPQLWKSISLSDAQILQNVEKARASRLSLVNQVENAYYTLLLASDSYKVVQQNYENAKLTETIVEGRYSVGTASEYELLRARVQVKNFEPELLQSEIAIKQANLQLKVLMGIDVTTSLGVASQLSDYQSNMYETALSLSRDLQNNTDLRSMDLQTDYLRKALKVQQMSWFPTLALTGNYYWTSMSNGSPFKNFRWNPYSTIGLSLSFPIFQGGQRYSKIKQAEIAVREMGFQRDNLERSLNMQVELQIENINKNVKQIDSNSRGVAEAEKAYSIAQKSYEIGAATFVELRDAELALTSARLAYYQAIYNYLVAQSDLNLLLGNTDLDKYNNEKK